MQSYDGRGWKRERREKMIWWWGQVRRCGGWMRVMMMRRERERKEEIESRDEFWSVRDGSVKGEGYCWWALFIENRHLESRRDSRKKSVGEVFFEERRVAVNNCSELIRNIALIMMNRCKWWVNKRENYRLWSWGRDFDPLSILSLSLSLSHFAKGVTHSSSRPSL